MEKLRLYIFIVPSAALLLMIILVVYLKKNAVNQQDFMQLFWSITMCSFILHFTWEMLQMPLYNKMLLGWKSTLFCALASVADTIMVLLIYYGFALLYKNNWWMTRPRLYRLLILVIAGGAGAALGELRHINLGTWSYSAQMPMIPALKVGLVPVLQFMLLPGVIYFLALSFKKRIKTIDNLKIKKMKKIIFPIAIVTVLTIVSCNSNNQSAKEDQSVMNQDSTMPMQDNKMADENVKMISATFPTVDAGVSTYMKSMLQNYLSTKNALIDGNSEKAASSSAAMYKAMKSFDKSLLTAEQKKVYDDIESDLKEHTEHISKNKLDHQREHFAMMSKDIYDMVKAFGAGMTLYHDHCPMFQDGSMWLSESKDIRNPYYGEKMMTCGTVEEMFN